MPSQQDIHPPSRARHKKKARVLRLVPQDEREALEVARALEDLASMVKAGKIHGLMFLFRTTEGDHLHGVAGRYRANLTEAIGSLTTLKIRLAQIKADRDSHS